jgi:hypothetical protein
VESIIGKLVTDVSFRRRFLADAGAALDELRRHGWELTGVETQALLAIDPVAIHAFASVLDGRLQKIDLAAE